MAEQSTMSEVLRPNYHHTGDVLLRDENTLRKLVGILGLLLPILLYFSLMIDSGFSSVLPSISHYYYTRACGIFVICISLLAIFLLIYKGEELQDYYVSSFAGIFALLVVLFPTDNLLFLQNGKYKLVNVTILKISCFRTNFHYISAAVFLVSLAYMSFFLFTKTNPQTHRKTKEKVTRNRIYRVCAVIMIMAIAVIFLGRIHIIHDNYYDAHSLTFWMEFLAVEAFAFSWMVKGKLFFTDKP